MAGNFRIENLADGCCVLFFERTHFEGTRLNIVGPLEFRRFLKSPARGKGR
jgi:hypothetical protein